MIKNGSPIEAVDVIISSLSKSTIKIYNSSLKSWWEFCAASNLDPYFPSVESVLKHLTARYHAGVGYSSINTSRSAISLLSPRLDRPLGQDPLVSRFVKGIGKIKPPAPKYNCTWDPQLVLDYLETLEPLATLSLESLTLKLVGLLALATGQRVQTLQSIDINSISGIGSSSVKIVITAQIKTSRPGATQPCLCLPRLTEKPQLCPVTCLEKYLEVTKPFRTHSQMFLGLSKNHLPVSTQTISRWIRMILEKSGVNTSKFGSHSTRHASTSTAKARGVPIDYIQRAAGWTDKSNTFAKFYNRPIIDSDLFARTVLLNEHQ